jgi:3-oxoacyl-[acyl-carrier-protein] synthase-3
VRISGVGAAAPETRATNLDLESIVETSDEWISKRTGISSRHLLQPDGSISGLAIEAAKRALESAGLAASEIDMVVLATSSRACRAAPRAARRAACVGR